MPLSRQDQNRVDLLKKASAHLRSTGAPEELAEVVDFVMTDEGANFVNRLRWKGAEQENPNLAIRMPLALREEIKTGAQAAGKSLTTQAVAALNAFLDGKYVPFDPKEEDVFRGGPQAMLNIRVNAELRRHADEYGAKLKADGVLDWAPLTSHVLKAWFVEKFTAHRAE
ncbi:hypothetical protein [Streptomyces misionensis]|uniref:hypothetical protein n=1 Tax=Streptomyces misionensis TaxID=67331 RepID=UPI00396BED01